MKKDLYFVLAVILGLLISCNGLGSYGELSVVKINSLATSTNIINTEDSVTLTVNTESPINAILSYAWDISGGEILTDNGESIVWRAPGETMDVKIMVLVKDLSGGTYDSESIMISVIYTPPQMTPTPYPVWGAAELGDLAVTDRLIINSVSSALSENASAGASLLVLDDTTGLSAGSEILLINQQGTGAGTYEFLFIKGVLNGTTLSLSAPVVNNYTASEKVFVYLVPHYGKVTVHSGGEITAPAWNPATGGGIIAFKASDSLIVDSSGKIEASGLGYRGANRNIDGQAGFQGEGALFGPGSTSGLTAANNSGGGAGGGAVFLSAGGGGGHAFAGATGGDGGNINNPASKGTGGTGGNAVGSEDLATLFLGGGGGSGADNDSTSSLGAGNGGGIIFITARSMILSNIRCNGMNGEFASGQDGGSGGGAGGSIFLIAESVTILNNVTATGGIGSVPELDSPTDTNNNGQYGGTGGNGSVGRIRIDGTVTGSTVPAYY